MFGTITNSLITSKMRNNPHYWKIIQNTKQKYKKKMRKRQSF